jgi:hypothetical protein
MKVQELNIVALENRFEMSATAEAASIEIGELTINL